MSTGVFSILSLITGGSALLTKWMEESLRSVTPCWPILPWVPSNWCYYCTSYSCRSFLAILYKCKSLIWMSSIWTSWRYLRWVTERSHWDECYLLIKFMVEVVTQERGLHMVAFSFTVDGDWDKCDVDVRVWQVSLQWVRSILENSNLWVVL